MYSGRPLVLFGKESSSSKTVWLSELECLGNETSLLECTHAGWDDHMCMGSDDDVYLKCDAGKVITLEC